LVYHKFEAQTSIVLLLRLLSSIKNLSVTDLNAQIFEDLHSLITYSNSIKNPIDKSNREDKWFESWESIIDKEQRDYNLYYCPQEFDYNKKDSSCEILQEEKTTKIAEYISITKEDPKIYSLPANNYVESLPLGAPKYNDYKMIKHWEKYIIPRIQDCLRAELSQYEFDDFFEQLRTPLRVNNHFNGVGIAYKLCNNNLPNGCILPDSSHDWSTLDIDEITVGDWVSMKLNPKKTPLISPYLSQFKKLTLQEI